MHIMVDIETVNTNADAVIIQLGASWFSPDGLPGYATFATFLVDVSVTEQVTKFKRTISPETVAWWLDETDPSARVSVLERGTLLDLKTALQELNKFISTCKEYSKLKGESFGVWANSPTFDLSIIRHAMSQVGMDPCWSYGREYDVRTLRFLNNELKLGVKYDKGGAGVAHNALDDSIGQSEFTKSVFNVLNTERVPPTKPM